MAAADTVAAGMVEADTAAADTVLEHTGLP